MPRPRLLALAVLVVAVSTSAAAPKPETPEQKAERLRVEIAELKVNLAKAEAELIGLSGAMPELDDFVRADIYAHYATAAGMALAIAEQKVMIGGIGKPRARLVARLTRPGFNETFEEHYREVSRKYPEKFKLTREQFNAVADAYFADCLSGKLVARERPDDEGLVIFGKPLDARKQLFEKYLTAEQDIAAACDYALNVNSDADAPEAEKKKFQGASAKYEQARLRLFRWSCLSLVDSRVPPETRMTLAEYLAIAKEGKEKQWDKGRK